MCEKKEMQSNIKNSHTTLKISFPRHLFYLFKLQFPTCDKCLAEFMFLSNIVLVIFSNSPEF